MKWSQRVWVAVAAGVAAWGLAGCGDGGMPMPPSPTDAAVERQA